MHSRNAQFMDETGCSQEIALEMLIGASWDVDIAMDEFREQQKEQQYKTDKTGLGGLSTSIWSWGAKAAAAATELSKDVAAKVGCYGPYLPATVSRKRRLLSSKLYRVWRPGGHGWNNEGHGQLQFVRRFRLPNG